MRTNMTTLTQTWMTLLLSNVLPSDHNSDLPLPKCQLVHAILTRMSIHVVQLIADAIYLFAGMPPTKHPLDPDKSNRALVMQSYPARALGRRLQVDWARDPREGPRVLMSLRVDFEPMG